MGKLIIPSQRRMFTVIKHNMPQPEQNPPLAFMWKSIAEQDDSAALVWAMPTKVKAEKAPCVVIPLYAHINQDGSLIAINYDQLAYPKDVSG